MQTDTFPRTTWVSRDGRRDGICLHWSSPYGEKYIQTRRKCPSEAVDSMIFIIVFIELHKFALPSSWVTDLKFDSKQVRLLMLEPGYFLYQRMTNKKATKEEE